MALSVVGSAALKEPEIEDDSELDGEGPDDDDYWPDCPHCGETAFVPQEDGGMVCASCIRTHPTLAWIDILDRT